MILPGKAIRYKCATPPMPHIDKMMVNKKTKQYAFND